MSANLIEYAPVEILLPLFCSDAAAYTRCSIREPSPMSLKIELAAFVSDTHLDVNIYGPTTRPTGKQMTPVKFVAAPGSLSCW